MPSFRMVLLAAVAVSTFALSDYTANNTINDTLAYAQMSERCGIDIPADTISYGNLVHGAASNGALLQIDNPASAVSHVSVSGTGWASIENTSEIAMPPSATHFSSSTDVTIPYSEMTPLSSGFAPLVSVQPSSSQQTLWKVMALPTDSSFGGTVSQEMTFRVMCEETGEDDLPSPVNPRQKIMASDTAKDDRFGWSVAINDNVLLVGANRDDDNGSNSGSAYVFTKDTTAGTWTESQKITASDGSGGDYFGYSVAINDNVLLVGAPYDDDNGSNSGSAYVFTKDTTAGTWTESQKITASDGGESHEFGRSVAISDDTIIVGAYGDDDNGSNSGSAYVFARDTTAGTWTESQKITASDGSESDGFGTSVAISDDTIIVGANGDGDNGRSSGSAYVFARDTTAGTWTESQKIIASDGRSLDYFGYSVAINDNVLIVGAWGDDDNGSRSGSAYVFTKDTTAGTWIQSQKIIASDGSAIDYFGWSVAISDDMIIASSQYDDDLGDDSGSAYIFARDSDGIWRQSQKIMSSDGDTDDRFGRSIAIHGDTVIFGTPYGSERQGYSEIIVSSEIK